MVKGEERSKDAASFGKVLSTKDLEPVGSLARIIRANAVKNGACVVLATVRRIRIVKPVSPLILF